MKKLRIKRILFCILLLSAIIYGILQFKNYYMSANYSYGNINSTVASNNIQNNKYSSIKEDININYSGKRTRKSS